MNICSGRAKFIHFKIILDNRSSSTIVMGKLTSKLKPKNTRNNHVGNTSREVHSLKEVERRFISALSQCNQNSVMEMSYG